MRKMINTYHLEGQLYDQNLEVRTTGQNSKAPGTEYIRGDISIATDSSRTNIIRVYYTYVVASQGGGRTWNALKDIIDGKRKTYMAAGDEGAFVRIDTQIAVNDFLPQGSSDIVSQVRNEGGFIHFIEPTAMTVVTKQNPFARNKYTVDVVMTKATHVEADEETKAPERLLIKAAAFNFRGEIVPMELTVTNPKAIEYFEAQDISSKNPFATQVWGPEEAITTIYREEKPNAFGDTEVIERQRSTRSFIVGGAIPDPYEWDSEDTITAAEFEKAIGNRNTMLAEVKEAAAQRAKSATAGNTTAAARVANTPAGEYDF